VAKRKTKTAAQSKTVTMDRRAKNDRRKTTTSERRKTTKPVATEQRKTERRKVQRRRQIDPTTCERDYSIDEIEFMRALDEYKRANGRMFPTCSEILEVVRKLGYVRLPVDVELPPPTEAAVEGEAVAEASENPAG